MNTAASCPRTAEAVGWALHALEPEEEMAVLVHLPQCAVCRSAVRDVEQVLGGLGSAVEQVDPPPSLRSNILTAAAGTPQHPSVLRPRVSPESTPRHVPPAPPVPPSPVAQPPAPRHRRDGEGAGTGPPGRARRARWLSTRGRRMLAASLALVGVIAVGGLAARTLQLEQQRDAAVTQAQSVAELMSQLDEPGTTHAVLANSEGVAVGAVLVSDDQRRLVTVGLPANATDRETYVLWGLRGQTPVAIGTFDVGTPEPGSGTLQSPAEASGFSAYAISLEPGRTAPASPTQPVASGQVES